MLGVVGDLHEGPMFILNKYCAGCLVVITDHGPRAEVARALRHELLVDSGEGRLEGLEEERQKREEKEIGEERQPTHTQRTDDHACME